MGFRPSRPAGSRAAEDEALETLADNEVRAVVPLADFVRVLKAMSGGKLLNCELSCAWADALKAAGATLDRVKSRSCH
jgi:hypothetical protein